MQALQVMPVVKPATQAPKKSDLLDCLARLKAKPDEHRTLFPGLRLTHNVKQSQFAAQIIGDVFEKLTLTIVGKKWRRIFPQDELDVRPDLGSVDGCGFIESKASKDRRYFKIATNQLLAYRALLKQAKRVGINLSLSYFLWSYKHDAAFSGCGLTMKDVIQRSLASVVQLDIIDIRIILQILACSPPNTQYCEYDSWRNARADEHGNTGYKALQISHIFLRRFRENSHNVLNEELDLKAGEFDLRTNYARRSSKVQFDGLEFKSKKFIINRYTYKDSFIEQAAPF